MTNLTAEVYLQIKRGRPLGAWMKGGNNGTLRVVKSTLFMPETLEHGCVLIKVKVLLPSEVFTEPPIPTVSVEVPADLVLKELPIDVEAMRP